MMVENPQEKISEEEIELILGLLDRQMAFYSQILSLSEAEKEKFAKGRPMREIFPLIRKRKILFSCAEEFAEKLEPIRPILKKVGEDNLPVKKNLKEIEDTLKKILDLDKENQTQMVTHLQTLKAKQIKLMDVEDNS